MAGAVTTHSTHSGRGKERKELSIHLEICASNEVVAK